MAAIITMAALIGLLLLGLLRSGTLGYVILAGTPNINVPNGRWTGNWRVRLAEVTQSDSGGGTLFLAVVQDNQWSFEAARDDTLFPEAIGFTPGTVLATVFFKLGNNGALASGAKADKLVNTTVESVDTVCDNSGDVVRVTVTGKGGVLTPNQTIT